MNRLRINREFLARHLGVCLLMAGMACWFAYDAFVTYPAADAAALYEKIEKAKPPEGFPLESFKRQKIHSQYGFAALAFLASAVIGLHLASVASFRFAFDGTAFEWKGGRVPLSDVKEADRSLWRRKGILKLVLADGSRVTLDAWHHTGVKEFEKLLARPSGGADADMV